MPTSYIDDVATFLPQHLSDSDRCDRCGSQAYVEVTLSGGKLLFCAHHYQQFEAHLRQSAAVVFDDRARLHACSSRGSAYSSTSP